MLKITILCENTIGRAKARTCSAEWGLSVFIQTDDINILFDTGHTDIYKNNAKQCDIDLNDTHFIVLSHHHWDHSGGLRFHDFKTKKKIIIHPHILEKLPPEEAEKIKRDFEITESKEPVMFHEGIYYLGEIPRKTSFEKGMHKNDPLLDDSAITIPSEKGVIIITGCSHSGICNICEYAKKITGQPLYAVIGGFHLFEEDSRAVDGTIEYFKSEKPKKIYPMHCVDFPTLSKLHSIFNIKKLSTGDIIDFEAV